jgi:Ca-activated chloride channel family protein
MTIRWNLALMLVGAALASRTSQALEVTIIQPSPLEPIFGEVEVVASTVSNRPIQSLELFVDDRSLGRLVQPPYRWIVDLGNQSSGHLLRVIAIDVDGLSAESLLSTPDVRIDERVDLELQQLFVTVTRQGETVDALNRTDFAVSDRGEPQTLVTFERGDVPLTAVVLVDTSESMRGEELEAALESTRGFIDGMRPLDQAMLLLFSDQIVRVTSMTGFQDVLSSALTNVTARSGTALNDHFYVAFKLLERRQGRRVIMVLSDGLDSASVLSMRQVLSTAKRSQSLVYWLRLPSSGGDHTSTWKNAAGFRKERLLFEKIVDQSGGQIIELSGVESAAAAFANVLEELRAQYVLGYYPTTRSDDATWHPVRVRARGAGLKVRTRSGYIDY